MEIVGASATRMDQNRASLDDARAWLSALIDNPDKTVSVAEYKASLKDAKKAISAAEQQVRLDEHIANVVSEWPPLEPWLVRRIVTILRGGEPTSAPAPESAEVIAARKAEEALARARRDFQEAMEGCHGCGLSRKAHTYQQSYATGYHQFEPLSPDGTIKVAQAYKKKITAAEKALEQARAA